MADLSKPVSAPAMLAQLIAGLKDSRAVRVVNFHATPRYREHEFRLQVAEFARRFEPITRESFASAVNGNWAGNRPGMLPVLFEGFRDNFDVMLPILEEHGFIGWFFIPPRFLGVPAPDQRAYAAAHVLHLPKRDEYPGERIAINWDEARSIVARGHVIACHSRTHFELKPDTPLGVLRDEIAVAKTEMERELGVEIDCFCWLRGAALGVNPDADRLLRKVGFRYLFSNFQIQALYEACHPANS